MFNLRASKALIHINQYAYPQSYLIKCSCLGKYILKYDRLHFHFPKCMQQRRQCYELNVPSIWMYVATRKVRNKSYKCIR